MRNISIKWRMTLWFSLLMIASLFALLLAYLDYRLKNRKRVTLPNLPPLLMVENGSSSSSC